MLIKKIKRNLNLKVFLGVFFLLSCISAVLYTIVLISLPDSYKTTMEEEIQQDVDMIKTKISGGSIETAKSVLYDYAYKSGYEIALIDGYGNIMYYSYNKNTTQSTTYDEENLLVSIVNEGSAVVYTNIDLEDISTTCVLYIYGYGQTINSISDILFGFLPLIITVIVLLSATGAFLAARLITRPIKKLSIYSQRMSMMEQNISCNLNREDELGTLSVNLDFMYGKLMYSLYELSNQSRQLQIEIEKTKVAEQKRKDFFAAVSHELKTPITILKGEIEGMIYGYGEYKDRDYYLSHTLEVTNQIEELVKEILLISKMTSDKVDCHFELANISDLVYDVYENYIPLANAKKIDILCDIEDDYICSVDLVSFKKVVSNILANAVNHSPEESMVIITLENGYFAVENTGVHISEEDMPNLFEPFYRIDRSRNRQTGGTGLGLYIVKTILCLHGFAFGMNNTNHGVIFYIKLENNAIPDKKSMSSKKGE